MVGFAFREDEDVILFAEKNEWICMRFILREGGRRLWKNERAFFHFLF